MKQSTTRTFELSTDECPAVYFCSVITNFDKPRFKIGLGYSCSDGDQWLLDRDQMVSLKNMLDEHLHAIKGVEIEGSYSNQFDYLKSLTLLQEKVV